MALPPPRRRPAQCANGDTMSLMKTRAPQRASRHQVRRQLLTTSTAKAAAHRPLHRLPRHGRSAPGARLVPILPVGLHAWICRRKHRCWAAADQFVGLRSDEGAAGPRRVAPGAVSKSATLERLQRRAHRSRSEATAAGGARSERRCWRTQSRQSRVGCRRRSRWTAVRARRVHRRPGRDMAGQPGHRDRQGVHGQCVQLRHRAALNGPPLYAQPARTFAMGSRERKPAQPALSRARRTTRRPGSARSAAAPSRSVAALALYKGQTRVGGLGVSGDTSCADHEIAKRVRLAAGLASDEPPVRRDRLHRSGWPVPVRAPAVRQHLP